MVAELEDRTEDVPAVAWESKNQISKSKNAEGGTLRSVSRDQRIRGENRNGRPSRRKGLFETEIVSARRKGSLRRRNAIRSHRKVLDCGRDIHVSTIAAGKPLPQGQWIRKSGYQWAGYHEIPAMDDGRPFALLTWRRDERYLAMKLLSRNREYPSESELVSMPKARAWHRSLRIRYGYSAFITGQSIRKGDRKAVF